MQGLTDTRPRSLPPPNSCCTGGAEGENDSDAQFPENPNGAGAERIAAYDGVFCEAYQEVEAMYTLNVLQMFLQSDEYALYEQERARKNQRSTRRSILQSFSMRSPRRQRASENTDRSNASVLTGEQQADSLAHSATV